MQFLVLAYECFRYLLQSVGFFIKLSLSAMKFQLMNAAEIILTDLDIVDCPCGCSLSRTGCLDAHVFSNNQNALLNLRV